MPECYREGQSASFSKTIGESDVYLFAGITGDFNLLHVNEKEAKQTSFKGRIAHGMLTASFLSTVIAMQLPGPGTVYLSQEVSFLKPVRIGDTVTAVVEIEEIMEKGRARLLTKVINQLGEQVVAGSALVRLPRDIERRA